MPSFPVSATLEEKVSQPVLGERLMDLLRTAGCNRIDSVRRAEDMLADQLESVHRAAREFELAPGMPLENFLWTSTRPLRDGSMSRSLAAAEGDRGHGLIILFADAVTPRAAYPRYAPPLSVREGIAGDFSPGGPFLVLIECEMDSLGSMHVSRGFAQAVLGKQSFIPVESQLERDVLLVLLAMQDHLEKTPGSLVIERIDGADPGNRQIRISGVRPDGSDRSLMIRIGFGERRSGSWTEHCVSAEDIGDGTFVAWLYRSFG